MSQADVLKTEAEHHLKAFEIYYAQSGQRSYREVAKQMGVSLSAVRLWARSFGWQRRLRERDLESARHIADKTLEEDLYDHAQHRKLVRMALVKVARAVLDGRVRITIADLDRLIRLEAILAGANLPTGKTGDPFESLDGFRAQLGQLSVAQLRELANRWGLDVRDEDLVSQPPA